MPALTNDQMIANRFGRWARARRLVAWIAEQHAAGRTVYVCTATKATGYGPKWSGMFKATRSGAFVQAGKGWNCIDYCKFTAE